MTHNDLFFVEQLIETISLEYNVDTSQVYAVGFDLGGVMAYGLPCKRGNLIAAGIMSGNMLPDTCNEMDYTSIIHFHGTSATRMPLEGDEHYQSVSAVTDFWLRHNNIPASSLQTTEFNGGNVMLDEYTGGNEDTSFVLYTINGGEHVWFHDDIGGTNANQILWDFLSMYSL